MKMSRQVSLVFTFTILLSACLTLSAQDSQNTNSVPSGALTKIPEHPITEEQMRAFFDVCHIPNVSRKLTHEKLELQRKQLPAWYPQPVWDEIETAIDNIDLPVVALPVYREHLSQELADQLIKFFSTRPGQDAVRVVLEKMIQAQHAGATPSESHEQALQYLWEDKNGVQSKILGELTPEQRRSAEALGGVYMRMQPVFGEINKEYSKALIEKQTDLVKAIVLKHQPELAEAKQDYEFTHKAGSEASDAESNSK